MSGWSACKKIPLQLLARLFSSEASFVLVPFGILFFLLAEDNIVIFLVFFYIMVGEHSDLLYRLSKEAVKQGKRTVQKKGEAKEEKKESDSSSRRFLMLIPTLFENSDA